MATDSRRHCLLRLSLFVFHLMPVLCGGSNFLPFSTVQSELGLAFLLPLASSPSNSSLAARQQNALHRRQLAGNLEANARMSLYDDLLTKGYYTSRLWIGTPPQEFALIVDTGSTVTYVPCLSCTHCGTHQDPRFNPELSNSYKPKSCGPDCATCDTERKQCRYEREYAERSSSKGLLGSDIVSFGKDSTLGPQHLVFGCETAETGDIYEQGADGIMGLGRGPLSIVDQLVNQKAMADSFSLCYGGMDEGGGTMIMGAIPSPPAMVFTYSDPRRSPYYNLGLHEVLVAGTSLKVDPNIFNARFGTVLDSGTTYAYFPEKAFLAFREALKRQVGHLHQISGPDPKFPDLCFAGAGTDISKLAEYFPQVDLKFKDGQIVSLAPENYMFKHAKVPGAYCLGIFTNGKDSATLLGGIIVRNMLVTYDRAGERIGFWKTNCINLWHNLSGLMPPPSTPYVPSQSPLAAVAPVTHSNSATMPVVEGPTLSGLACIAGSIEVEMSLKLNQTTFNMLRSAFLEDLSRALQIDVSQVKVIDVSDAGATITVSWAAALAATDEHLLNITAMRMITRLEQHEVHLDAVFGAYEMTKWRVVSGHKRFDHSSFKFFLLGISCLALAVVVVTGLLTWRYICTHYRNAVQLKYTSLNQKSNEFDQL